MVLKGRPNGSGQTATNEASVPAEQPSKEVQKKPPATAQPLHQPATKNDPSAPVEQTSKEPSPQPLNLVVFCAGGQIFIDFRTLRFDK